MHIRQFVFLFASLLFATGCSNVVITTGYIEPRPMMMRDAGPMPMLVDAGRSESDTSVPERSSLTVSLHIDSPASAVIPRNATGVTLVVFDLLSGPLPVTTTALAVHRTGVGSNDDFTNVYLYDRVRGLRLTVGRNINRTTGVITFNGLSLTQGERSFNALELRGDLNAATGGGQHAFEIVDVSAVSAGEAEILGTFPVRSNILTVGSVLAGTLTAMVGSDPPDVTSGTEAEVASFVFAAYESDIGFWQIMLTQGGSIAETDLDLLGLYHGPDRIGGVIASASGYYLFQTEPEFTVPAHTIQGFTVRANVSGPAGRTIRFWIEYQADVSARDVALNAPAHVDNAQYIGLEPMLYSEVTVR